MPFWVSHSFRGAFCRVRKEWAEPKPNRLGSAGAWSCCLQDEWPEMDGGWNSSPISAFKAASSWHGTPKCLQEHGKSGNLCFYNWVIGCVWKWRMAFIHGRRGKWWSSTGAAGSAALEAACSGRLPGTSRWPFKEQRRTKHRWQELQGCPWTASGHRVDLTLQHLPKISGKGDRCLNGALMVHHTAPLHKSGFESLDQADLR